MTDIPLLPTPLVIQRHYRWPGDYHYVEDYLVAVETESCHNCDRGSGGDLPSIGCPIADKALDAYQTADTASPTAMPEWYEVEPGRRIRCKAWTDRAPLPGQQELL